MEVAGARAGRAGGGGLHRVRDGARARADPDRLRTDRRSAGGRGSGAERAGQGVRALVEDQHLRRGVRAPDHLQRPGLRLAPRCRRRAPGRLDLRPVRRGSHLLRSERPPAGVHDAARRAGRQDVDLRGRW